MDGLQTSQHQQEEQEGVKLDIFVVDTKQRKPDFETLSNERKSELLVLVLVLLTFQIVARGRRRRRCRWWYCFAFDDVGVDDT